MSIKVKQGLRICFEQIEGKKFDENTIRTLLILSREYLNNDSLIKELAHFIAHPSRDKGIFHEKVNSRYTKYKLVQHQVIKSLGDKSILEKIKTEGDLSDFMLGAVGNDKIESKLFEILYFDGLNDISEQHLKKYTRFNKQDALKELKKYYIKKNGFYTINRDEILSELKKQVIRFDISQFDEETQSEIGNYLSNSKEAQNYIEAVINRLDNLQKVIRGTIHFRSVFSSKGLFDELISSINDIINKLGLDRKFIGSVKNNKSQILLCIMTLLHDSKFIFYDGNNADVFLCVYLDPPLELSKELLEMRRTIDYGYNNSVIALYMTLRIEDKSLNMPLFVSDLRIRDYVDLENFTSFHQYDDIIPIPWIVATRKNGTLILSKE